MKVKIGQGHCVKRSRIRAEAVQDTGSILSLTTYDGRMRVMTVLITAFVIDWAATTEREMNSANTLVTEVRAS